MADDVAATNVDRLLDGVGQDAHGALSHIEWRKRKENTESLSSSIKFAAVTLTTLPNGSNESTLPQTRIACAPRIIALDCAAQFTLAVNIISQSEVSVLPASPPSETKPPATIETTMKTGAVGGGGERFRWQDLLCKKQRLIRLQSSAFERTRDGSAWICSVRERHAAEVEKCTTVKQTNKQTKAILVPRRHFVDVATDTVVVPTEKIICLCRCYNRGSLTTSCKRFSLPTTFACNNFFRNH